MFFFYVESSPLLWNLLLFIIISIESYSILVSWSQHYIS